MQNAANIEIGQNPDWHGAATNLVMCLSDVDSSDMRVLVLDKLARKLDGHMYPAFLRILYTIAVNGKPEAKALLNQTFLDALNCGLVPQGTVPAWGAQRSGDSQRHSQDTHAGNTQGTIHRLGPIEFTCVWFLGNVELPTLLKADFARIVQRLLEMFSEQHEIREKYAAYMIQFADHGPLGSMSHEARRGVKAVGEAWLAGEDSNRVLEAFFAATTADRRLAELLTNPFT